MDPVSHAVLGRLVTVAVGPQSPARGIAAASILGALSPDVDFLLMPVGWDIYLREHVIGTHSIVGGFVTGLGSALLVKAAARSSPFRILAIAAVMGAWSHLCADIVSGGQIEPGWPIWNGVPFAPLVAMADPWTIAILAGGAVAMWRCRERRRVTCVALTLLIAFLSLKGALLAAALGRATFEGDPADAASRLVEAERGSLTRWHVFDRAPGALRHWVIDTRGGAATLVMVQPTPEESAIVEASRTLGTVRNFLDVHRLTFAVVRPADAESIAVLWSDIRYCRRAPGAVGIECSLWFGGVFGRDGRVLSEQVRVGSWWQKGVGSHW